MSNYFRRKYLKYLSDSGQKRYPHSTSLRLIFSTPGNIILCLFMLFLSLSLSRLSKLIPFHRFFFIFPEFPSPSRKPRKGCLEFIWTGNSFQIFETDGVKTSSIRRPKTPAAELISGSKPTWDRPGSDNSRSFSPPSLGEKLNARYISGGRRSLNVIESDSCGINVYILKEQRGRKSIHI